VERVRGPIIYSIILLWFVTTAFGSWISERKPVILAAHSLNVRVTEDGQARRELQFEVHKAITFDREEMGRTGAFEKACLKSALTDSLGLLSFGEVKPGRYWVVPKGGSINDSVAVEVTAPSEVARPRRLWLSYNAEGDLGVSVEAVNGDAP
jgi:hypothetical protein